MKKFIKEFICYALVVIISGFLIIEVVEAWDRSHWPNLTVIDQQGSVIQVRLDDELTEGTDMANQLAGEAVLTICEDGYLVSVLNWNAVSKDEIINIAKARELADEDRLVNPTIETLAASWLEQLIKQ